MLAGTAQLPSLPRVRREFDPLSAPTGFTRAQSLSSASLSPDNVPIPITKVRRVLEEEDNDRAPRKRINRGESSASPIAIDSSPDYKMSSQGVPSTSLSVNNHSSDSELPDAIDLLHGQNPSKPRIIRGHRPEDKEVPVDLTKLILTHPMHDPARVTAAFTVCDGDVKAATLLMEDPTWMHESPQARAFSPYTSDLRSPGASTSKRAAEKVKGKKSMIYAKRNELTTAQETITPVKHEAVVSVDSPMISKPFKWKVPKHVVASSESEGEHSESNGDESDSRVAGRTYYDEALRWLNECELTSLVELAGARSAAIKSGY